MTELLSPAGNKESFFAAINNGANAVYLGLDDFSARKSAENFSRENLSYYIDYAHALLGIKVYVALNTLVKNEELERFFEYAEFCNAAGVDGVILQDIFLGKHLKARFPDLPLHLSTQAGVNNADGARLAKEFGFSRVVLSRETPIEEIKKISEIIETECFIQGALCTAFSGQCYMSGFAGNMSGNRGLCKQPCRKKYTIKNGNETREGYLISLADLSIGKDIFSLIDAGVTSFKIEGRMRKPSFVAAATRYYRNLLDGENPSISALTRTFNRGDYTKGLGFGQDKNLISDKIQSHKGEFVGAIKSVKNGIITAESSRSFVPGDSGKIIRSGFEVGSFTCDKTGVLRASGSAERGDELNITTDVNLETELLN
ncbi:MAG: U32 family peptidase, partial [Clostridia bacterium]|nr:U32 family peptidase [Clostridia bacterium]